jgi:DNA-binding NarL/FixJ family response regulator
MAVDGRAEGVTGLPWADDARREVAPAFSALTRREADVVALAARGWTSPAIADERGVSVRTVESHLYRAFAKLGVSSRDELRVPAEGS